MQLLNSVTKTSRVYDLFNNVDYLSAMKMEILTIKKEEITINAEEILSLMGNSGGGIDLHTMSLIETFIIECKEIMTPQGAYALFKANESESKEHIEIEGKSFHIGKVLKKMLAHSTHFAFFVASVGEGPETMARSLMEKSQFLEAYLVDLIGSEIAESVAKQVHHHIKNLADELDMKATNHYSPGYCTWDVAEQQKLFSLLPENRCGITLSDSSLMSPIKSISGIVGIGTDVKYQEYTCEICPMKHCFFRKTQASEIA